MRSEGFVRHIFIAPEAGAPMQELPFAEAISGGLRGDRYQRGDGFYSNKRVAVRDVTLMLSPDMRQSSFTPKETRRNLIVEGEINWPDFISKFFTVGETEMFGTEECTPCLRPSVLSGRKENFLQKFKDGFGGGIRAKVIKPGLIFPGDVIRLR